MIIADHIAEYEKMLTNHEQMLRSAQADQQRYMARNSFSAIVDGIITMNTRRIEALKAAISALQNYR